MKCEEGRAELDAQTHELEVHHHRNVVQQCLQEPGGLVDLNGSSVFGKYFRGQIFQNQTHYAGYKLCVYLSCSYDWILEEDIWENYRLDVHSQNRILYMKLINAWTANHWLHFCYLVLHWRQVNY